MNISKYTDYFHDGGIYDISQNDNNIVIAMESAEMDPDDMLDNIILSKDDRIKGKLHIENVNQIKENDHLIIKKIEKKYPSAEITHLTIERNKVLIEIMWGTYPPSSIPNDYSTFEIDAEKVYWENIPDLINPYGR